MRFTHFERTYLSKHSLEVSAFSCFFVFFVFWEVFPGGERFFLYICVYIGVEGHLGSPPDAPA